MVFKTINYKYLFIIIFVFATFFNGTAQVSNSTNNSNLQQKSSSIEKSYKKGESDLDIAYKYEDLAKELVKFNDFKKAEEYQKKAVELYKKHNKKKELTNSLRELAKIQEALNKTTDAIQSYDNAAKNADVDFKATINTDDASRLRNINNPNEQSNSINKKIKVLTKNTKSSESSEDIVNAYKQMAEVNVQQNNSNLAIENYNNALDKVENNPTEKNNIKNEIANIYVSDNNLSQAIIIKKDILKNADSLNDVSEQINQRQGLAKLLILNNEDDKALLLMQDGYNLALTKGKTIDAKNSLMQLILYYKTKHDDKKTLQLYEVFLQKLEDLIKSDTTLIDQKLFTESDNKIRQLEKEKTLKDELISRTNTFNYSLIITLIVLFILILIIIRYSMTVRTNNKKISLQSLRREMNPHFIFNSLNSVNQFIAQNKEIEANKYLTSYSSLMRNMMESSSKDFISLQKEIDHLQKYLELEHLRFSDQFDFEIRIDDTIDTDAYLMPNMLVQPHLENAIWHGLRYKESKGLLVLSIVDKETFIEIAIDDNGIGVERSKELKTENQKIHQSIGIKNIDERIKLLNDIYKLKIRCFITNKPLNSGTIVTLHVPRLNKI